MTAAAPARIVHPGDSEPSCRYCRYFSGHTSWCPDRPVAARTPRRHNLYTMSAERIAREVIGRSIRVTTWERGAEVGVVESVENGRTVVRLSDGKWTYGPSGRVTVR